MIQKICISQLRLQYNWNFLQEIATITIKESTVSVDYRRNKFMHVKLMPTKYNKDRWQLYKAKYIHEPSYFDILKMQ